MFCEKHVPKNSQENTFIGVSFLIKLQSVDLKLLKKETPKQMLYCNFCFGYVSWPYFYDAIRNTNRNYSAPLKKVEQKGFGIFSAKCEQN